MPTTLRRDLEDALDADLSGVVLHDDAGAHVFAGELGAQAATWRSHVYFGRGRFAPETAAGQELLRHELVHTLQPDGDDAIHRSPESEARLREIERLLASFVITDEYRAELERERAAIVGGSPAGGPEEPSLGGPPMGQPIAAISMTEAEYEQLTGRSAALLPEQSAATAGNSLVAPPRASEEAAPRWSSGVPASAGVGSLFMPQPNWYYRVLSPTDPTVAEILGGANLLPRPPDPGFTFQPAASEAEMTFRHLRPGGNVPRVGTDRISTAADLEAFQTLLANRGTGELVRVDVNAAREFGARFLEQGDVMAHLEEIGRQLTSELEAARAAGRGSNYISRLEGRLRALNAAKEYARIFQEGQGVGSIPSRAITPVEGATLEGAVIGERALVSNLRYVRYGGRVLLIVGVGMSIHRIATAPPEQQLRVATQEAGGWAFSLGGGWAGAKIGAGLGAAFGIESGPGAVITAAIGGLVGAAVGFFGGEEAAEGLYEFGEDVKEGFEILGDPPRLIETSLWMFGTPEARRDFYEMRELETGEPPPWEGL